MVDSCADARSSIFIFYFFPCLLATRIQILMLHVSKNDRFRYEQRSDVVKYIFTFDHKNKYFVCKFRLY